MLRATEIGLIGATVLSVLAFGGTEAPYFPIAQALLLGIAILLLASYRPERGNKIKFPVVIPLILVILILLQITPLPASIVQLLSGTNTRTDAPFVQFSVAPHETLLNFVILLSYLAVFYLTLVVCRHRDGSKHLIFALLGLGTFEACYGIVQYLTGWRGIFATVSGNELEAATGTYINPDHFAGLLEMILPFALALSYYQFEKVSHEQAESDDPAQGVFRHEEFHKFLLWMFLAIVLVIALVASQSRMGIISAAASALLLFTMIVTSRWRRSNAGFVIAIFIAAAVSAVIWIGPESMIGRFQTVGQEYAAGGQNRLGIWLDTLKLIGQHPFLGSGLGTYSVDYPSAQTAFVQHFVGHAHEDYLEFASELGIPGAFLLFGAIFYVLMRSIRRFRESESGFARMVALGSSGGLTAILLHSLADFNLHIPANGLLFSLLLGLAYAETPHVARLARPERLESRIQEPAPESVAEVLVSATSQSASIPTQP